MNVRLPGVAFLLLAAFAGCSSSSTEPRPNVGPLIGEGWSLYEEGDYEAARERFTAALAADAEAGAAHAGLGFVLARLGDYHSAAQSFQRAIELDTRRPEPYAGLALAEGARNHYQAVVAPASRLLALVPFYLHPHDAQVNARAVRLVRAHATYHAGNYSATAADLDVLDPASAPHSTDPVALLEALAGLSGLGATTT